MNISRFLLLFLLASASAATLDEPLRGSDMVLEAKVYASIPDAAIEGLRQSLLANDERNEEWGGAIVEWPGHLFKITKPRTDHYMMAVRTPIFEPIHGHKVVGDYHTHVCGHNPLNQHRILSDKFSPADMAHANAFHLFGFILDNCLGTVFMYDPSRDHQDPEDGPWRGHAVGWIKEVADD